MTYHVLAYLHLAAVIPAFAIGCLIFWRQKGTGSHKILGRLYMLLMMITALVFLLMPARVGPAWLNHFGYIHLLSLLTLYTVPAALIAARSGQFNKHKARMIYLYAGGILLAGGFALTPGRLLHTWLFA